MAKRTERRAMKPTQEQELFQRALRDTIFQASILHAAADKLPTGEPTYAERALYACTYYGYLLGKYGAAWVKALLNPYSTGDRVRYIHVRRWRSSVCDL
jgi:hypothetical protein